MAKARAQVKIILEIGEDTSTWITTTPIRRAVPNRSLGVALAIGEAAAIATAYALKDAEQLAVKLAELERSNG